MELFPKRIWLKAPRCTPTEKVTAFSAEGDNFSCSLSGSISLSFQDWIQSLFLAHSYFFSVGLGDAIKPCGLQRALK